MKIHCVKTLNTAVNITALKDIPKYAETSATMKTVDTKKNVHTNMYRLRNILTLMSYLNKDCSNTRWISNYLMKK